MTSEHSHTVGDVSPPRFDAGHLGPEDPNGWYVGPADDPDRYELLGEGIVGGEGITWRARYHGSLDSPLPLAVKVQHPPIDPPTGWPSAQDRSRWRDQTTLLRHMRLDHLVRVNEFTSGPPPHHLGQPDSSGHESIIIEMEWVEGESLATTIRTAPTKTTNVETRARWIEDACTTLARLHSFTQTAGNPTVHRDVSPTNCLVTSDRGLVLIDVSTMQLPRDGLDLAGRHTPAYSAPEVLAMPHNPRLPSADIYAVGALAFFCLTGQDPPPDSAEGPGRRDRVLRKAVKRLALAPGLTAHVLSMLAPEPNDRPHDLQAWGSRFRELAQPRRPVLLGRSLRRPVVAVPLVALIAAGVTGASFWASHEDSRENIEAPQTVQPAPVRAAAGITRTSFSTARGSITSPTPGTATRDCEYFIGTASPKPGNTLMLAMHNLSETDAVRYVEVVYGFERPATLASWRGAQYFNEKAIGQQIAVELIEVPLPEARKLVASSDHLEVSRIVTAEGEVVAAVVVTRAPGKNPAFPCEGPG
ncbi:serine/threonine protein kinase [Paractinoplanes lichenicola]|uniref:non-specific serine/threonine protein kinase n=1 Tax=Paractinoplanes lichenicola TaxID=2802976 RepID=A0ABS1VL80_9ACTN|nr:protein kinase [Actinoplanes lichenicola]MBL7255246.1 protein kinase [Actinoplanes lichenicola]